MGWLIGSFVRRVVRGLLRLLIVAALVLVLGGIALALLVHHGVLGPTPIGRLKTGLHHLPEALGVLGTVWLLLTILDGEPPKDDRD